MGRKVELFVVVGILLLVFALYSSHIGYAIQCDEANTVYKYASNPVSALFAYTTPNNHLLHSFLVWITTSLMGFSHIAVRYTALMAGMLTFAMAYHIGRKLLNHHGGLATIGLLAVSMSMVNFSLSARGYSLSVFLTLVVIYLIFLPPQITNRRKNYAIIFFSFCVLMVLPSMVLLLFPIIIWNIWRWIQTRETQYIQHIISIIVGGLCAICFYLPSIIQGSALEHLSQFGEPDPLTLLIRWVDLVYTPVVFGVASLVFLAIGITYFVHNSRNLYLLAGLFLIVATAIGVAIVQYMISGHTLYARNYFYLLPLMTLISGIGLAVIVRQWTLPIIIVAVLFMSLYMPQLSRSHAIDQLLTAIPEYQPETPLLVNHACHSIAAYYELTEIRHEQVDIWSPASPAQSVMIPIPVGLKISTDRAIVDNGYTVDQFAQCNLVEDDYDWLDIHICQVR